MPPGQSGGNRWLIYALGGGLGHLTRAIALARVARASGHRIRILTNSPFAASLPLGKDLGDEDALIRIDPTMDRHAVATIVRSVLSCRDFDVLIVDTFLRGLAGELDALLDDLSCPKVLIHRDIDPAYVRWAGLESAARRFDLLILPGEDAPLGDQPHAVRTDPWLLRDHGELLDFLRARMRLNLRHDHNILLPVVVVVGCGRIDEIEAARALAERLGRHPTVAAYVGFVSVTSQDQYGRNPGSTIWPLLEVMAAIDVLVGSGGYNTVHEARATATPLVALARPRKYDRQAIRLSRAECASDEADVIGRVEEHLAALPIKVIPRCIPTYTNGVHAAIELIERLTGCPRS